MAKENGQSKDLGPVLEAEKAVRAAEQVADAARAKLAAEVTTYMKKHGQPAQRTYKDENGKAVKYDTFVLPGFIPVEGGSIELRLRRTQDGSFSGVVLRKSAIGG